MKDTGRILFAIPFAVFGLLHFIYGSNMAGIVPSWLPGAIFWVYLTGLAMIAAAVALITKKQIFLASILLAVLMLIFVLTVHLPSALSGGQMSGLLKDFALGGAALMIAGVFKQ